MALGMHWAPLGIPTPAEAPAASGQFDLKALFIT